MKRRDLGEADRLLTLYTPTNGKVDAVAKGVRKPTSKKTGHVELYTRADVLIAKGRSLDILTQAEMLEAYVPLREDLLRGAYASYVVELLDRFTLDDDVAGYQDLFILLDMTLERLCTDDDVRRVTRYYELQLLNWLGFRPELQSCVISQQDLLPEDQFFSYHEGGVVSPEAATYTGNLVPLPLLTFKVLRHLQRSKYAKIAALRISDVVHLDMERIMLGYIRYILEKQVQSAAFIQRIRNMAP